MIIITDDSNYQEITVNCPITSYYNLHRYPKNSGILNDSIVIGFNAQLAIDVDEILILIMQWLYI